MKRVYYEEDANLDFLEGKTVAVMGYGSQGHAQSQNLQDSGVDVVVGIRKESSSFRRAQEDGLQVATVSEAAEKAHVIQLLVPDEIHPRIYQEEIEPYQKKGSMLLCSHGFSIHFHQICPRKDIDVGLIAPKSPGHLLRRVYQKGGGVPSLLAIAQDYTGQAKDILLAYARGIGSTRAGVIETTFKEETETDLFGEQTVLCGGVTQLIKMGFEVLTEAGYQPEVAYFECLHELKLIVDLIYEGGLTKMRDSVSTTAEYGDYTRGPRIIDSSVKTRMKEILLEIQNGTFAREWALENRVNRPVYSAAQKREKELEIELVGQKLRQMMSWLDDSTAE